MKKEKIRLGDKVKCKYTGFTGIVVAKTEFINGCVQFTVAAKFDKKNLGPDGLPPELPIDEQSLILVDKKLRKPTKKEKEMAEEMINELEEEEDDTGGPGRKIKRRNY